MNPETPTPARPEEAEAVTALLAAQLEEHAIPLVPARLAEGVARALTGDGRALILVSRERSRPVGVAYLSFHFPLETGAWIMWLEELYVLPELRGRGIGGALLQAALDVARERGCVAADLEVVASHVRAANLYARAGFRPLDRVHWTLSLD
jgi:GNAT superfamily N-acetyltransferase